MPNKQPPLIVQRIGMTDVEPYRSIMNGGTGIATLDELHAEIHRGLAYGGGSMFATLADDATTYFVGQNTNTDKYVHIAAGTSVGGDSIVSILGGITGRTGGVACCSYNRKTGLTDSGVDAWCDATSIDGGVAVKTVFIPGGAGPKALGGSGGDRIERIISPLQWIGLSITNISGSPIIGSIEWDFYIADE